MTYPWTALHHDEALHPGLMTPAVSARQPMVLSYAAARAWQGGRSWGRSDVVGPRAPTQVQQPPSSTPPCRHAAAMQ